MDTWFKKPQEKLVTYKKKVPQHNPDREEYQGENAAPYDHTKYAQCDDYVLTKIRFSHTVKDCETRINCAKNSDHYPIYADIRTNMKLAGQDKENRAGPKKYWKPDQIRQGEYNRRVFEIV